MNGEKSNNDGIKSCGDRRGSNIVTEGKQNWGSLVTGVITVCRKDFYVRIKGRDEFWRSQRGVYCPIGVYRIFRA